VAFLLDPLICFAANFFGLFVAAAVLGKSSCCGGNSKPSLSCTLPLEWKFKDDVMNLPNLFADLPKQLPEEVITSLLESPALRIERIVSQGHASPPGFWYDQPEHEWVVLLKGAARLRFEDEVLHMNPGDFIHIPAHKKHRVDWTWPDEPTIWLAIHYGTS
jgi:cupin 2 domain-containing protein